MYKETETVELKQELNESVKKEIIAFLNSFGGKIIIGVDDNGIAKPITNSKTKDDMDKKIGNWIDDVFYPKPTNLIKFYFNSDDVMVIEVKEGMDKPYYLKEKGPRPSGVYRRVGRSARQVSEEDIRLMLLQSNSVSFEEGVSEEQELTFDTFFNELDKENIKHDIRQLKALKLINKDNEYTNLALLLSDQSPIKIKFAKYDKEMNFVTKQVFEGSLLKALNNVIEKSNIYNDTKAIINGKTFKRIEKQSYPDKALREAFLNAFIHADYLIRSNIKIEFYDDCVKITNPGGIYNATLEDILGGIQTYRNPNLVNVLYKMNYIENFGTGIPRIINEYKNSRRQPVFNVTHNFFSLVIPNANIEDDPIDDPIDDPLNDFELILLKTIKENPGLNVPKLLMKMNNKDITKDKIKNSLKRKLSHYVEFKGSKSSGGYYILSIKKSKNKK